MTPAPLPIQLEELVICQIVDGQADTTLVHRPAVHCNKGGFRFDSYDFAPATWPAACGIGSGSVYVRAGLLADAPVCSACEATEGFQLSFPAKRHGNRLGFPSASRRHGE